LSTRREWGCDDEKVNDEDDEEEDDEEEDDEEDETWNWRMKIIS